MRRPEPDACIPIVCGNFSPHLPTATGGRAGTWAKANSAELAYTGQRVMIAPHRGGSPHCYFALHGTDHASHQEHGSMIRRYNI